MIIPLEPGLSFIRFRTTLSDRNFVFIIRWLTRFQFYSVDIFEGDQTLILGRGLHPGVDLFHGLNLGIGTLSLQGLPATPGNLGRDNKLRYEE